MTPARPTVLRKSDIAVSYTSTLKSHITISFSYVDECKAKLLREFKWLSAVFLCGF